MATFVLVAGAFHGAWAWNKVSAILKSQGHNVIAVDLTGQGSRLHDVTPDTNLSTHINDVVEVIEATDLQEVILVGHSYSGLVITGAADRVRGRVAHLVYVDATVPSDGMSAADYAGPEVTKIAVDAAKGDWLVANFFPISKFGPFASEEEAASFSAKLVKHPMATFFEKISLTNPAIARRTFVKSIRNSLALFDSFALHAKTAVDWQYFEIDTGHDAMLTAPEELSKILARFAAA